MLGGYAFAYRRATAAGVFGLTLYSWASPSSVRALQTALDWVKSLSFWPMKDPGRNLGFFRFFKMDWTFFLLASMVPPEPVLPPPALLPPEPPEPVLFLPELPVAPPDRVPFAPLVPVGPVAPLATVSVVD